MNPPPLHRSTPAELKDRLEVERRGLPFLAYRDAKGAQVLVVIEPETERLTVGRAAGSDIWIDWDSEVSRLHVELQRRGDDWTVVDDGLSRNGTFVNGERLQGRRRLAAGDEIRTGDTVLTFSAAGGADTSETSLAGEQPGAASLTEMQRKILLALCRPFADGAAYATPATNQQIADEVFLSVDAVKKHLRTLFGKFAVEDVPQNQKRASLVERAFQTGAVLRREL
jgi:pSer/pThr/pTyr-binding forkhead associated (FHA) protein